MPMTVSRLDEKYPMPLYEQLAQVIRSAIKSGDLKPNDAIPTELELAKKYGVSRTTARQALMALEREGLIYRKRGKGSFVCEPKVVQSLITLRSFSEEIRILGFTPGAALVRQGILPADGKVADRLEVPAGEPVLEIVRLRLADGKELSLNRSFIPKRYADLLTEVDLGGPSLYQILEQRVGKIVKATEIISASAATPEEARILKVRPQTPLLRLERTTYIYTGEPVEFVLADFRPDRYVFSIELRAYM